MLLAGDTGGLLADDWITPETYKLELIHRLCPDPSKIEVRQAGESARIASSDAQPAIARLARALALTPGHI